MFDRLNPFGRKKTDDNATEFGGNHRIELRCPETMALIATENTDPDDWDSSVPDGEGIATYECPACGDHHRYLWGPPVPFCLDDDDGEEEEEILFESE